MWLHGGLISLYTSEPTFGGAHRGRDTPINAQGFTCVASMLGARSVVEAAAHGDVGLHQVELGNLGLEERDALFSGVWLALLRHVGDLLDGDAR